MNHLFLTIPRFIRSKITSMIEEHLPMEQLTVSTKHDGYTFVRKTTARNFRDSSFVGVYKNAKGKSVVIKDYMYHLRNLDYEYLHNEISALELLGCASLAKYSVRVPRLVLQKDENHRITIISEFMSGESIARLTPAQVVKILTTVYTYFWQVSEQIYQKATHYIPLRRKFLLYILFPIYAVRVVINKPSTWKLVCRASYFFGRYSHYILLNKTPYTLTHRDLSPDNILYDKKTKAITVLDAECICMTDKLHDLSSLPRMFIDHLSASDMMGIIDSLSLTGQEKKRLIALLVNNCMNKLATEIKFIEPYTKALDGLNVIVHSIIPALQKEL
jgi:serine/threonine protein kinase